MQTLVLDTNIALDLLVFGDPKVLPLRQGLAQGLVRWIATSPMRDELERVLGYPKIAQRLAFHAREPHAVLADYDRFIVRVDVAPRAPFACKDPDDQKFIDLAVAHGCVVLSKDAEVLKMRKRLERVAASARAVLA
jgi:predicted nucleic acid-binding protein